MRIPTAFTPCGAGRTRIAAILVTAALAAGCTSTAGPRPTAARAGGGTLRVALTSPTEFGLDPQGVWNAHEWELLRCCLLRTLMTYPGVAGFRGTQPLPDLAVALPSVSADGKTWTFHLRRGIHYAPPLEDIEVTAGDVVRALLRVVGGQVSADGQPFGPGLDYLRLIEGFSEYADGSTDTISGVSTPDEHTLRVRAVRRDSSLVYLFAMPFTAPIPPLPGNSDARFGAATGHPLDIHFDPPSAPRRRAQGYGPFLIATGPYMLKGAADLDLSLPPERQVPIAGLEPAWGLGDRFQGHISLVRNPSWDPATDANRPARANRIEIAVAPSDASLYRKLGSGGVDAVMGEDPPLSLVRRYRSSPSLRDRVVTAAGSSTYLASINVAQPPFDDPHVRRALALALDRGALGKATLSAGSYTGSIATHLVPDPMEGSFLASWNPFPTADDEGDLASARIEMNASRYGNKGRCSGPACREVLIVQNQGTHTASVLRAGLADLGISAVVASGGRVPDCADPKAHVAVCEFVWYTDYPAAGNMFVWLLSALPSAHTGPSLLGSTPEDLRAWHYAVRRVPSIDGDYQNCSAQLDVRAALCWARLDQLVVGELVAVIPLSSPDMVRLQGADVVAYSLDQAWGEPSLDRIAVKR